MDQACLDCSPRLLNQSFLIADRGGGGGGWVFGLVCSLSECARDSEKVAKSIAFQSFAGEKDDAMTTTTRPGRDGTG